MLKPFSHYTDMPGYLGDEHPGYLIALEGASRLYEANEAVLLSRFIESGLREGSDYIQTSIGGWMGSCNFLLINEKSTGLAIAEGAALEMADYPVLDDEVLSGIEYAEAGRRWNENLNDTERRKLSREYCNGHNYTSWETVRRECGNMSNLVDHLLID